MKEFSRSLSGYFLYRVHKVAQGPSVSLFLLVMMSLNGRSCVFCKMDLLIKTAIWSEVTSDFHIEPDGEGSMFSYNFSKFLSLQNDAFSEFGLHENVKLNLAILN